jgi:hypothetical protein
MNVPLPVCVVEGVEDHQSLHPENPVMPLPENCLSLFPLCPPPDGALLHEMMRKKHHHHQNHWEVHSDGDVKLEEVVGQSRQPAALLHV